MFQNAGGGATFAPRRVRIHAQVQRRRVRVRAVLRVCFPRRVRARKLLFWLVPERSLFRVRRRRVREPRARLGIERGEESPVLIQDHV